MIGASQVVQRIPLPMWEMQGTQVWFLDQEDPLEEEMATGSSILAWKIPWREEPGGLQSMGSQRARHDWASEHARTRIGIWLFQARLIVSESLQATCNPPLNLLQRLRRTLGFEPMQCLIMGKIETSENTVPRWPRVIEEDCTQSLAHACRAFWTAWSSSQSTIGN